MSKKIYLTPKEQEIFRVISRMDVITHEELKEMFPGQKNLNRTAHELALKGYLYRIKRGAYMINEDGRLAIKYPYSVASSLYRGYIGLSSALRIHGIIDYEPFTVFVVTRHISGERRIGEYMFKALNFGERATGQSLLNGIYVSTLEKTLFDCLYKPNHVGYSITTKALYESKTIDWKEFIYYFRRFASPSLCQRIGFLLDQLSGETGMQIPVHVMEYFRCRMKTKTRLMPSYRKAGSYSKEWKVMDNVGKKNFLSWWYNG